MRELFLLDYDADIACALYVLYESGDDSVLDELLRQIMPLIHRTLLLSVERVCLATREYLEADALLKAYRLISDRALPTEPSSFTRYLSRAFARSGYDSLRELSPSPLEYWRVGGGPDVSTLPTQDQAEDKIYKEQLIASIRNAIRYRIRFVGVTKEACEYILDCYLLADMPDPCVAMRKFSLTQQDYRYLEQYVLLWIKSFSWEVHHEAREACIVSPVWKASRGLLRSLGVFRQVYLPT